MNLRQLSLASFNLYNLNLPGRAMYRNQAGWSEAQYQHKVAWAAQQLRLLQADVVGFQELWHRDALQAAVDAAGLANSHQLLAPPDADGRGIACAALVRNGLLDGAAQWIADFPEGFRLAGGGDDPQTPDMAVSIQGFSRPVLRFAIRPRAKEAAIQVWVCHFKSKAPTQVYREPWFKADKPRYAPHSNALGAALSTIRRTAEAAALRWLLTEANRQGSGPQVVLGDINDGQHSNTANILTEQPVYLQGDRAGGRANALYTAQTLQQYRDTRDVYYTHVHQGIRESLDHILLSEAFYDHSKKRQWLLERMVVLNDHLDLAAPTVLGSNDHGIVRASFSLRRAAT